MVLGNLGIENTALGFVAGFTGEEIVRRIEQMGVRADLIRINNGISRINVKLQSIDGTEINGCGPQISERHVQELLEKLDILGAGDVLILAGSIPGSMPDDMYRRIMERLEGRGVMIAVDATKDLLVNVLTYHPFLVKPNNHELGEIFGAELKTREEVIPYAKKMQEMGAVNVLVSMAGEGAVLAAGDGSIHDAPAPEGRLINGVGGRRLHGGRLPRRLDGAERLRPCFCHGNSGGKCQRFLRTAGNEGRSGSRLPAGEETAGG